MYVETEPLHVFSSIVEVWACSHYARRAYIRRTVTVIILVPSFGLSEAVYKA